MEVVVGNPNARFASVSLNTHWLREIEAATVLKAAEAETGPPSADPARGSAASDKLVEACVGQNSAIPKRSACTTICFVTVQRASAHDSLSPFRTHPVLVFRNGGARRAAPVDRIAAAAQWELKDKEVPSIAIAPFYRSGIVWSQAWGYVDAGRNETAGAWTLYRAGSVSKLLTDVAVMQRVEQGRLDLDMPVQTYLPSFRFFGARFVPRCGPFRCVSRAIRA